MPEKLQDFRTDQEKRQDNFEAFLEKVGNGTTALIRFCGERFKVKFSSRRNDQDIKLVSFEIIGNKHGYEGDKLVFNLESKDETELLKII